MIAVALIYMGLILGLFTLVAGVAAVWDWIEEDKRRRADRLHHRNTINNMRKAGLL